MRDILTYTFSKGYFDNGSVVEVPDGSLLPPSSNVLFDKNGRLMSFSGLLVNPQLANSGGSVTTGGTRAFLLDRDTVGFLGKITGSTVNKANGNMLQSVGKSLWFVGNDLADAVKAVKLGATSGYTELTFGGTLDVMWLEILFSSGSTLTNSGTLSITFTELLPQQTDVVKTGGVTFTCTASLAAGDDKAAVMDKIRLALRTNDNFNKYYYSINASSGGNYYVLMRGAEVGYRFRAQMGDVSAFGNLTATTSQLVVLYEIETSANLSKFPHYAKWNGTGWSNPVTVGLPEVESTRAEKTIRLEFDVGSSGSFAGLVQGSRSVRVARKRLGSVSIASSPSNVTTVPEQGGRLRVLIPPYAPDGSLDKDNTWLLYFTYKGLGSTATHKLFPLEISEIELRGYVNNDVRFFGNAKYQVTKAGVAEADREVTVEFTDADLLAIDPLDDAFPAEECKFIAKLGNVMCLIGTGDDQTGFDVSIPNNFEGYNPEWRDWLSEVPVSLAVEQDLGFFWILTANNVHMAEWTGVTEGAAPVVLRKVSSVYGAIGEGASVCVNGMLYFLTRGKTPVVISPQGQVNPQIGAAVQSYFLGTTNSNPTFDENTQVSWDENTNSVVFSCNGKALALQLSTGLWSAPIDTNGTVYAMVPINGYLNVCRQNTSQFQTLIWDRPSDNNINWKLASNFQFGKSGRALKDIIQVEAIVSSPTATSGSPQTITFKALKNFNNATEISLTTASLTSQYPMISVREYTESLDYDNVAALITGTKGGQGIHSIMYTVQAHTIERQK